MSRETSPVAVIALAAGQGKRMKSALPKVMHRLAGEPMIAHVLRAAAALSPVCVVAVVAPKADEVQAAASAVCPGCIFAVQETQHGTGHAAACAGEALKNHSGPVLIVYGDTPLLTPATLQRMATLAKEADLAVLGMRVADPTGYGRLVLAKDGSLERIVECRDASAPEKAITLCNSGVMAVSGKHLFRLLAQLGNANAGGEYYLTDIVALARAEGLRCAVLDAPWEEVQGINSRAQLAQAERIMQKRLRDAAMANGATLVAPETVFLAADTVLGQDTVVHPYVVFGPGVRVGNAVEIRSFCHLAHAVVDDGAVLGPYARLRPGARIGEGAHIGNFVEIKQAQIGAGAKVNHLSYVGDTKVGEAANIGAGVITCNYDGFAKHRTEIGAGAFIGSNVSLVAPLFIGEGAIVGAGSVVTQDVPEGALSLERGAQQIKPGGARRVREKRNGKGQMSKVKK